MTDFTPDGIRAALAVKRDCERCANEYRCDGVCPCEFSSKKETSETEGE